MTSSADSTIGILPAGALGVAFAWHLSNGFRDTDGLSFLPRSESKSAQDSQWGEEYTLLVDDGETTQEIKNPPVRLPPLPELDENIPSILLAGPFPDQLFSVLRDLVAWFSKSVSKLGLQESIERMPVLVMTSNGIYFQRLRRYYLELLEEAVMLGVIPDLWPDKMPLLVGRLLRGVTIQTGLRTGAGEAAVYRPGPSGWTTLAGGSQEIRQATCERLQSRGMNVRASTDFNPTRIEFDKATVNLAGNLFGQILAIDEAGRFERITIGETHNRLPAEALEKLVETLVSIGKAVRAYPESYSVTESMAFLEKATINHRNHVASSVQLLESKIASKSIETRLPPTEAWLLDPLTNFARARHLETEEAYLNKIKHELIAALQRAKNRQECS